MFDPTAYENFKIILEGSVYDYDMAGDILVSGRSEIIDLAVLSRAFTISFHLTGQDRIRAAILLRSSLKELADEILEENTLQPSAFVDIEFMWESDEPHSADRLAALNDCLWKVWGHDRQITLEETRKMVDGEKGRYYYKMAVSFRRRITEEQSEDLYSLATYCIKALDGLLAIVP
ncbi:hypothetical protein [Bacillus testis]|uniref:hypothetical protein n=1 Tax=Bacillus testis TaxID=1622072 RepID=UPI00067F70DB|nr:hypothetical protein [Bacillus testis]